MGAVLLMNSNKKLPDAEVEELLHLRALSEGERILDIDAEVADRALDLRMAKQNLYGA
jgi:hypothetical protein